MSGSVYERQSNERVVAKGSLVKKESQDRITDWGEQRQKRETRSDTPVPMVSVCHPGVI